MIKVLVTGSRGQLGQSIRSISEAYPSLDFIFTDREELDITDRDAVRSYFRLHRPDYCVNCAAYTNVDKAESEPDLCIQINVIGVENLVAACSEVNCVLSHISTDFVFDGRKRSPYSIEDKPNPINVYGKSKHKSEQIIEDSGIKNFIVRTSWLYSEYGHNFVKSMLRLSSQKDVLSIVNDQIGAPTYAGDLADFLLQLILTDCTEYGLFHYSNEGSISWLDFAHKIFALKGISVIIHPITSEMFNASATRPEYSVLNLSRALRVQPGSIKPWEISLERCLDRISKN